MIKFNYYEANIKASKPLGLVTLERFIESIRNPKKHIISIYNQIKEAHVKNDEGLKNALKQQLYSFTPAVQVKDKRSYQNIISFTGLMPLDFDKLPSQNYATEFKNYIFDEYPFIVACWLSASGHGVRSLVSIPVVNSTDQYKLLFDGISHYNMDNYMGFDHAPKNCVLPLFLSYDKNILYREDSMLWDKTYEKPQLLKNSSYKSNSNPDRVKNIITSAINKITGNGHPQLRAAAFCLGGYVGSGSIDQQSAEQLIYDLIDSNKYLSQKSSIYKKTASTMIEKGASQPIHL